MLQAALHKKYCRTEAMQTRLTAAKLLEPKNATSDFLGARGIQMSHRSDISLTYAWGLITLYLLFPGCCPHLSTAVLTHLLCYSAVPVRSQSYFLLLPRLRLAHAVSPRSSCIKAFSGCDFEKY